MGRNLWPSRFDNIAPNAPYFERARSREKYGKSGVLGDDVVKSTRRSDFTI